MKPDVTNDEHLKNKYIKKNDLVKSNSSGQTVVKSSSSSHFFSHFKFQMILVLLFCCLFTFGIKHANTQETNYFYTDEIQVDNQGSDDSHFDSLVHTNFFSVFSNEIPILNSVENQSLNGPNSSPHNSIYSASSTGSQVESDGFQLFSAKFEPSHLNFKEQQIAVPKLETVVIFNTGDDALKLESISGSTIHFYCSFFLEKIILPGGNTSFDVYFLARDLGLVESVLYINTNKGIVKFTVMGFGMPNPFKLKPILNARIPLNSSFTSLIQLHNPNSFPMQVLEIFTSDDDLHVELSETYMNSNDAKLRHETKNTRKSEIFNHNYHVTTISNQNHWTINPFQTRPIALLNYIGRFSNNHTAFVCIKASTNQSSRTVPLSFVMPIELEVSPQAGLFSPIEIIDFLSVFVHKKYFNLDHT
jgi:hypothetical protein